MLMAPHRNRWRFLLPLVLLGCVSYGERGCVVDIEACRRLGPPVAAPAISAAPLKLGEAAHSREVISGLAWALRDQESVQVILGTARLRCSDFHRNPKGGYSLTPDWTWRGGDPDSTVSLVLSPVSVDSVRFSNGEVRHFVPEKEIWRVNEPRSLFKFPSTEATSADPARDAATQGRRTRVGLAASGSDEPNRITTVSGTVELEGCGVFDVAAPLREQPHADVRLGDRRVPIRGATYRIENNDPTIRLSTLPIDCSSYDTFEHGDVTLVLRRNGVSLRGDGIAAQPATLSGVVAIDRLTDAPDASSDGGAAPPRVVTFRLGGTWDTEYSRSHEKNERYVVRSLSKMLHLSGQADVLVCPPVFEPVARPAASADAHD